MALKVKELIEQLQKQDPEARVLLYVNEEWNGAAGIQTKEEEQDENKQLYYKSDSPDSVGANGNYILITDYQYGI